MRAAEHVATITALQAHELNVTRACRRHLAHALRLEADDYEMRAIEADPSDRKELEWISFGLRIAAAKVDP